MVSRVLLDKGKSKFNAKDKDGFTPLLRCCQESPMTKDTPSNNDQTDQKTEKEVEDKIKQDKSRAEIIKALVAKGANIKIAGKFCISGKPRTMHELKRGKKIFFGKTVVYIVFAAHKRLESTLFEIFSSGKFRKVKKKTPKMLILFFEVRM